MAERASLKASGSFKCNGSYMFFELILTEKQYLIRYYNDKGKLKLIRPIKMPSEGVEFHTAGHYLLCYLHCPQNPIESELLLVKLDTCRKVDLNYQCHLPCRGESARAISQLFFNPKQQAIVFSDEDQNVYLLDLEADDKKCRKIYQHDKIITRIQSDRQDRLVLVTEDKKLINFEIDWELGLIDDKKIDLNHGDYYCQNGFQLVFSNRRVNVPPPRKPNQVQTYELEIKMDQLSKPEYEYWFPKESEFLIYTLDNLLVVFCPKQNAFLSLVEGVFQIHGIEEAISIPKNIKRDNFLITYKKDSNKRIMLEVRVYDELTGSFTTHHYFQTESAKNPNIVYLRKNIENVFCFNGLIEPIHEPVVRKGLKQLESMEGDFHQSKSIHENEEQGERKEESSVELANKLLRKGLYSFPAEMTKIIQRLKGQIMNNKNIYWILQTQRFFQHFQKVNNEIASQFKTIQANLEKARKIPRKKGEELRQINKNRLEELSTLLQNMINFMSMMIKELQADASSIKYDQIQKGEYPGQSIFVNQIKFNASILGSAKSLFAIGRLLQDEKTGQNYKSYVNDAFAKKQEVRQIWHQKYPKMVEMQYYPYFLHEHFLSFEYLPPGQKPTFDQFVQILLASKERFLEIGYFYTAISRKAVPFLDSDVGQLMEYILLQVEPIGELRKEEGMEGEGLVRDLLHKMAATVLKLRQISFVKYLIQVAVYYNQLPLVVMLAHSNCFELRSQESNSEEDHIFMMKSLLLAGKFDLSYLYVLNHHSRDFFKEFLKFARINGNLPDLLQFKLDKKLVQGDEEELMSVISLDKEEGEEITKLLRQLESM